MDRSELVMTLVFVDVPTFPKLREAEGEDVARDFLDKCMALLKKVIDKQNGAMIRSVGATLLCSFDDPRNALCAACEMVTKVVSHNFKTRTPQTLRMGLHCGSVKLKGGSCSGEAVTTTSRMVTIAVPGQIIATAEMLAEAQEELRPRFQRLENAQRMEGRLKTQLYEVDWEDAPTSVPRSEKQKEPQEAPPAQSETAPGRHAMRETMPHNWNLGAEDKGPQPTRNVLLRRVGKKKKKKKKEAPADMPPTTGKAMRDTAVLGGKKNAHARFCAIWHENVVVVDEKTRVLKIGRNADNDVVVSVDTASRYHARVEQRETGMVLIDTSSNGTFVYNQQGDESYVEQDEMVLTGSGAICVGCPQDYPGAEPLLFWMT